MATRDSTGLGRRLDAALVGLFWLFAGTVLIGGIPAALADPTPSGLDIAGLVLTAVALLLARLPETGPRWSLVIAVSLVATLLAVAGSSGPDDSLPRSLIGICGYAAAARWRRRAYALYPLVLATYLAATALTVLVGPPTLAVLRVAVIDVGLGYGLVAGAGLFLHLVEAASDRFGRSHDDQLRIQIQIDVDEARHAAEHLARQRTARLIEALEAVVAAARRTEDAERLRDHLDGAARTLREQTAPTPVTRPVPDVGPRAAGSSLAAAHRQTLQAMHHDTRALPLTAAVLLSGHLVVMAFSLSGDAYAVAQLALSLALGALALGAATVLSRRAPSAIAVLALSGVLAAGLAAGLELAGPGSLTSYDSFIIGIVSVSATVISFVVPARWAFVVIAPCTAVTIAFMLRDQTPVGAAAAAISTTWFFPIVGASVGAVLRTTTRRTESVAVRAADLAARVMAEDSGTRTPITRWEAAIGSWLDDGPRRGSQVVSEAWARRGAAYAAALRDDGEHPGLLDDALALRILRLRAAGTRVVLPPGSQGDGREDLHRSSGEVARLRRSIDRQLDAAEEAPRVRTIQLKLSPSSEEAPAIAAEQQATR